MFSNRRDAGERLGDRLAAEGVDADIVLGIPRGALPVARPVADALDVPLDVVVASKLSAPGNPELALGAVASDGSLWLNEDLVDQVNVPQEYIDGQRDQEADAAQQKAHQYRDDGRLPDLADKRVVLVDDGVATGATAIACLRQVTDAGAAAVILAVPVGSPNSIAELETEADEVIALETPNDFRAVEQYYRDFGQVSDEQAMSYLDDDTDTA
ncbi:phosphoribosyltransferase [Natrialba asiatica]|uniref:Phosphoribosyltransferase n=1 Tax=Natrialba asiatica (strain ATCC 700177 / DSM 12278 / JCM 9576 / FERM P-10747 / NBRC 102637 / 172P1) TaxID=29540 RepID=M0B4E2_NATA1|nr:phosphoribosyltransferase family protein [Natrialba asiatica]ELZ05690.1 phosphoribosyltransferase [Natrialba asiatica DSM 12278]